MFPSQGSLLDVRFLNVESTKAFLDGYGKCAKGSEKADEFKNIMIDEMSRRGPTFRI